MGAQLNIKSDEAYELASRLSKLTGESLTEAVTGALRRRVAEEERERDLERRKAEIRALAAEIRAELTRDGEPLDLSTDFLYDEKTGLPV